MADLTPRLPAKRPLQWPDRLADLQEVLLELDLPPLYIVGGAVRDALLNRPVYDFDLAAPAGDAIKAARRIADRFHGDIFVMDRERDVARVFLSFPEGRLNLDVAGFRGETLADDLEGRDFTVNAMAVDLHGDLSQIIDPFGGESDLDKKILRRCSSFSLISDPVRTLRAVRQSVALSLRIEPETLQDVKVVEQMHTISPERVRDEWVKLLALDKPASALRVAHAVGLLNVIVPEVVALQGWTETSPHMPNAWEHTLLTVEKLGQMLHVISYKRTDSSAAAFDLGMMVIQFDRYRKRMNEHLHQVWPNERPHISLLMMAALLSFVGQDAGHSSASVAEHRALMLKYSSGEVKRLVTIIQAIPNLLDGADWSPLVQHRFWHRYGEAGIDIILVALANYLGSVGTEIVQHAWLMRVDRARTLLSAYYDLHDQIVAPPPVVNGDDLLKAINQPRGAWVGRALERIREAQVLGEVTTAEGAISLAWLVLAEG